MGLIGVLLLTVILYPAMIYDGNIHIKTGDTKVRLT